MAGESWSLGVGPCRSNIRESRMSTRRSEPGRVCSTCPHMGEVLVDGPDALAFVQKLITNDAAKLEINQVLYSPMCYMDGGTVDDLLVYKKAADHYLLVINAANIEKDWNWMQENAAGFKVKLANISDATAQLALQGPLSERILSKLTAAPLAELKYYWFMPEIEVAGKKVLLSRNWLYRRIRVRTILRTG